MGVRVIDLLGDKRFKVTVEVKTVISIKASVKAVTASQSCFDKAELNDSDPNAIFNLPVLDESVANGKKIKFSHNPRDFPNTALSDEWNYLQQEHGFKVLVKKGGL